MVVDPDSPRFARQRILGGFGPAAQRRLTEAHVVVVGAGGLGSALLPALAAAGVGELTIVDDDTVDASNLHRQTLFTPSDVGRPKVDAAADALARIAPDTVVHARHERFAPGATFDLLLDADLLADGTDNRPTRYLANDAAAIRGIPLVWGSALRYSGQVGVAWDERGVDFRDLLPEDPDADGGDTCEIEGVLPTVCAVIGAMMASEVIKLLTGVGEPLLGRVAAYDALTGTTREIAYRRDPQAPRPGSLEERTALREPDPGRAVTAEQLAKLLAGPTTAGVHETPPVLLDVRERPEASFASLPGSVLIPLGELPGRLDELDPDAPIVVYCHHGVRSARGLEVLERAGFTRARHLTGGIEAWSVLVDPAVPRY
ncbi:MAG: ThiF family adenylyltransferase [Microbacteriaceae bacterium]|nr:ThiF family adenylyltransferase [Microbacteriaceae bacterium]